MSIEELIQQQVGIKPGANDLTPMDYLECKTIAEKYASQQVQEYKEKLKTALMNEFYKKPADEIYDLIDKL